MRRASLLALPELTVFILILALCEQGVGLVAANPDVEVSNGQAALPSACETILNVDPEVNSSAFLEVCGETQFGNALRAWGTMNFTWGTSSGPNGTFYYYGFLWLAPCWNVTLAHTFGECSEQEYWAADPATGNVSGPFFQENPATCMYCPAILRAPPVLPVFLLLAVPIIGIGTTLAFAIRRRSHKPPKPPTTLPPAPSSPQG